jgi:hypothetical protein
LIDDPLAAIPAALAEIVEVSHGNGRQSLITLIAVVVKLSVENLLCGRPTQGLMRFIHLRQQFDICGRIAAGETVPPVVWGQTTMRAWPPSGGWCRS